MRKVLLLTCLVLQSSCSLAPTYQRPVLPQPVHYKESGKWLRAQPDNAARGRGPWWQLYQDPVLNQLEDQVVNANQDLQAALARYEQARAIVAIARSDYFPTVSGVANVTRQKTSRNVANVSPNGLFSDFVLGLNLNYELDVWGRVRNTVAAAKSMARASAADLALINLSLHAELATDYFNLRSADAAQRTLDETVTSYQKALYLTRQRFQGGAVSAMDVDQAETQLETATTQAADTHIMRAQLEHAIAVLIGKPPALFSLAKSGYKVKPVVISPNLPSTLLERRPDIAVAEFNVEAANYNIGVARAAYFPAFNLATAIGFDSGVLSNLLKSSSLAWSLGPTLASPLLNPGSAPELTQVIFDGGKIAGLAQKARAQYDETVAQYKQSVLSAYKDVEDSLVAIHQLDSESRSQLKAKLAAQRTLSQAMYRYRGGLTTYLDVVVVQNIALQAQLSFIDIQRRRQVASVQLIKALGGGWNESQVLVL
jgi:NodT family efflux transporter outer membrane factor (OMF) lipoprotein